MSQFYKKSQEKRLSAAIGLAGARYTPKLNVEVNITSTFDGLGRTEKFYDELKRPANEIIKNVSYIKKDEINKVAFKEFEKAKKQSLDVANILLKTPNTGVVKIDFNKIFLESRKAREAVYECVNILRQIEEKDKKQKELDDQQKVQKDSNRIDHETERFGDEKRYLYKIGSALNLLMEFSKSNTALAANNPRILLSGIAGSGKTHFLCDLSSHRIKNGLLTYIFLGEEFNSSTNPWDTVRGLLGLNGKNKDLMAALNRYAAAKHTRLIIIVDAVNESQIAKIKWEQFNAITKYKNLGVILSIRSGFERSVLAKSVLKDFIRVEHEGFADHEWEALTKFFIEYKLPLPEIPVLFPEFRTPLFLKIFCEGAAKSSEPIKGHYGFTHIFERYVKIQGKSVLEKLGENGESARRIWNGTIKELALYMGVNGTDRISEKNAISIAAKEFPSKGKKVLDLLEKYWLITKVPRYKKYKVVGFEYRFPYQKFSDHLIVRNLLNEHLDKYKPENSFKKGTVLGDIITDQWNRGLIEALSIQVPERLTGRELVYVTPKNFRFKVVAKDTFLESMIWRNLTLNNGKPKYLKIRWILNYINKYILPYPGGEEKILETIITVSAIPNHPLNADLLHGHLKKKKMPERDAYWLPFINSRFGDEGAANRLLIWAWNGENKNIVQDHSLRLAGIMLSWFLASSNRFLRDRATKAIVSIFAGRVHIFIEVLEEFKDIDDSYIQERLCAAGYGCILQPEAKKKEISELAIYMYEKFFKDGNPPLHILIRDYARGIIEFAITQDKQLENKINLKRIRPPYNSSFPKTIPSLDDLKEKYPRQITDKNNKGDYGSIWNSLMYSNNGGLADFGHYVVDSTLGHWCNLIIPKNGVRDKTVKEIDKEFRSNLSRKEKAEWQKIEDMIQSIDLRLRMLNFPINKTDGHSKRGFTKEELGEARVYAKKIEKHFIKTLNNKQQKLYKKGVLPYREKPMGYEDLNYAEIERLIFQRVIELGWRPELFARYDSTVREEGRSAHKSERIGKKYQWIAFYEVLGNIADNFLFRGYWRDEFDLYEGTWQIWKRDIDPSCLLSKTPIDPTSQESWWVNIFYKNWRPSLRRLPLIT